MSFAAGDTFINREAPGLPSHLWIIISDTDQTTDEIVIVNLTSWREDKDPSCRLQRGEHPFITRESCVGYRDAKVNVGLLEKLAQQSLIVLREPATPELLRRIGEGAARSKFLKLGIREILEKQGLI